MRLSLPQLAAVVIDGSRTVLQLALAGELHGGRAWVGAKGAAKYLTAIAASDIAGDGVQADRAAACALCPARRLPGDDDLAELGWCGDPLVERLDVAVEERTCGCLLDGKIRVGSEKCPRGKWG